MILKVAALSMLLSIVVCGLYTTGKMLSVVFPFATLSWDLEYVDLEAHSTVVVSSRWKMPVKEVCFDISAHNVGSSLAASYDDVDNMGEGDVEIDIEEYLRAARRPIEVTRRNKIICTAAFSILITSIILYETGLVYHIVKYKKIALDDDHFSGPTISVFILMFTDVLSSCVGIWTCLKKTGPQPMIYTCIWLLLSSLVNLCVTISLTFETQEHRNHRKQLCEGEKKKPAKCLEYTRIATILWCSLLFFILKIIVIILCRFNYPQVFNWMMGKDVYVDQELIRSSLDKKAPSSPRAFAIAFFDPPDIARIAARGSIDGTVIEASSNSQAIFITKEDDGAHGKGEGGATATGRLSSRGSTFVAI